MTTPNINIRGAARGRRNAEAARREERAPAKCPFRWEIQRGLAKFSGVRGCAKGLRQAQTERGAEFGLILRVAQERIVERRATA